MKRLFDIVFSLLGLIIISPVFIILSLIIVLDSRGGVFFRGVRIGQHGKDFRIFKFRSMVKDAEGKGKWNVGENDNRITRFGHFLRKSKLDELPQLINVLIGDMSFVGPRPELRYYVNMYTNREKKIIEMKPGITDWASVAHFKQFVSFTQSTDPDKEYVERIRPLKLELQLYYYEHKNFRMDIRIIAFTVLKMIFRNLELPKDIQEVITQFNLKR
ncbi:MAG: sugar transferase [Mediterranea sp.]|nr:sugar transferase [Mediterranea sp.]